MDHRWLQRAVDSADSIPDFHDEECFVEAFHYHLLLLLGYLVDSGKRLSIAV